MSKIIALIGAPASGKTTLSLDISARLSLKGKNTKYIFEYPRNYIERFGHPTNVSEELLIFLSWKSILDEAMSINYDYLICDNPLFITYIYGTMLANISSPKDRKCLQELLESCLSNLHIYDMIFYVRPKQIYNISDGLRIANEKISKKIDGYINAFLNMYKIPHIEIENNIFKKTSDKILSKIL
jgi:nicotinamide riboside kinase